MRRRQPVLTRRRRLPVAWLFTDERLGDVAAVVARLPRGAGVVLRHHELPAIERRVLAARLAAIARRRGLMLVDECDIAKAHDRIELIAARRRGAGLVFVSPIFATRTHPGARGLGPVRFGLLVRNARVPVAVLGGMTAARFQQLRQFGASAWGGIDAWLRTAQIADRP